MKILATMMPFLLFLLLSPGCAEPETQVASPSAEEVPSIPGVDVYSSVDAQQVVNMEDGVTEDLDVKDGEEEPVPDVAVDSRIALTDSGSADVTDTEDISSLEGLDAGESTLPDVLFQDVSQSVDVAMAEDADGEEATTDIMDSSDGEQDIQLPEPDVEREEEEGWRSALYPKDWFPGFTDEEGRFLHDFSYAGYANGEEPLPTISLETVFDVLEEFGADASGSSDATAAIQSAIDAATEAGGGVVYFPEGVFRVDGQLLISASNVVLKGVSAEDSRLFFSKSNGMSYQAHIRFAGSGALGPDIALAEDAESGSFEVFVDDATTLEVGQDIVIGWVITDAFVEAHDMTGTWEAFNGTWQPFFQREVISLDTESSPHRVQIDVPLRYRSLVSDSASVRVQDGLISEVGVETLGLSNAVSWDDAWDQDQVHVLAMENVKDAWIRQVESFSSPLAPGSGSGKDAHLQSSGILVKLSKRVSVVESTLSDAENIGSGGNGYLFEVRQSDEVLFRDCVGKNGRHNFIQNWGFGTTGCVWLRVESEGGTSGLSKTFPFGLTGYSEFHHSLATANLIDSSIFHDGFSIINRGSYSSGAGHTGTENVFWNISGTGVLRSKQFGWGYVIGTAPELDVQIEGGALSGPDNAPIDYLEGKESGGEQAPSSLYEDQLKRRLSEDL